MAIEPKKMEVTPLTGQEKWDANLLRGSRHTLEDLHAISEKGLDTHEGRKGLASYLHGNPNALNDASDQTIDQGYKYVQGNINAGRFAYATAHAQEVVKQTGEPIVQHQALHDPNFKFYLGEGEDYNSVVAAIGTAQIAWADRQDPEKTKAFKDKKINNNPALSEFEKGYWSIFSENMLDAQVREAMDKYIAVVTPYGFARAVKNNVRIMKDKATQHATKTRELETKLQEMVAAKVKQLGREELVLQNIEPLTTAEMAEVKSAWKSQYKNQLDSLEEDVEAGKDYEHAVGTLLALYDHNDKASEEKAASEKKPKK